MPPAATYRRLQSFYLGNTVLTPYIFMPIKGNMKLQAKIIHGLENRREQIVK